MFVGSPNWCGTIAPPLASWLRGNDLSGKRVLPFASHCGGVAGDMQKDVAALCPKAQVGPTLEVLGDGGGRLGEIVALWLESALGPYVQGGNKNAS